MDSSVINDKDLLGRQISSGRHSGHNPVPRIGRHVFEAAQGSETVFSNAEQPWPQENNIGSLVAFMASDLCIQHQETLCAAAVSACLEETTAATSAPRSRRVERIRGTDLGRGRTEGFPLAQCFVAKVSMLDLHNPHWVSTGKSRAARRGLKWRWVRTPHIRDSRTPCFQHGFGAVRYRGSGLERPRFGGQVLADKS